MTAVFFTGICICLALSSGNIKSNLGTVAQVQESVRENSKQEWQLRASQQAAQAQAEIAEERYRNGCVMVVAMSDPKSFTTLSEGQPVIDRVRRKPLPSGTIVCDANGNTAKIVLGVDRLVVGEIAFTGNQEVIQAARKRSTARYALPNQ